MLERDIRKALKDRVGAYGGELRAVAWLGRAQAPDVLVGMPERHGLPGWHAWVETKAPGEKPRPGQLREHERMRGWNCDVVVISTIEQLDAWLPPL